MRNVARRGLRHLSVHKDLLAGVSKLVTRLVYDPETDEEHARRVIQELKTLSASIPEINFHSDKDNMRIILSLNEEALDGK